MGTGMMVAVAGVVLLGVLLVVIYNGLVTARNRIANALSQIAVQLQRRHDLIPNLVEVAKGYMAHERDTLEAVITARNQAVGALSNLPAGGSAAVAGVAGAEAALGNAVGRLFALAESYPDLKADASMGRVQEELASTENRVAFARQACNDAVLSYNNRRETFPANLIAGNFGFAAAAMWELEDAAARQAPKVSFVR